MSNPNLQDEYIEFDYQCHLEAGLIKCGTNEDNEVEWIGTDKEWSHYKELINNYGN